MTADKSGDGCCLKGHLKAADSDCSTECVKNADCGQDTNVCLGPVCAAGKCVKDHVFDGIRCTYTAANGAKFDGVCRASDKTIAECIAFQDGGCISDADCTHGGWQCQDMQCDTMKHACHFVITVGAACRNNGICAADAECLNCKQDSDCPAGEVCGYAGEMSERTCILRQ